MDSGGANVFRVQRITELVSIGGNNDWRQLGKHW
jgi:hypothetical protein